MSTSAAYQSGSARLMPLWPKVTTLCGTGERLTISAPLRRLGLGDLRRALARRQAAEDVVDQRRGLGRGDVADHRENQPLALDAALREGDEIVAGDRRDARLGAVGIGAVGMRLEGGVHPQPARQAARVARLALQDGDNLGADPLDVLRREMRVGERQPQQLADLPTLRFNMRMLPPNSSWPALKLSRVARFSRRVWNSVVS